MSPWELPGPYDHVTDVGADVGSFAQACLQAWSGVTVDSFEPLRQLANLQPDGPWQWHQTAIGREPGRTVLWQNEFSPSSSLLEMCELHREAFPYTIQTDPVEVDVARLDAYAERVHGRALLKIDVQGYELHVLEGAGELLDRYAAVVLEVSWVELYRGAAKPVELWDFLTGRGFVHDRRVDEMPHPVLRHVLQSDELFVRAS